MAELFNPVQIPWASYSGAGMLTLSAGGTNQNIALAPSGTGMVVVPAGTTLSFGGGSTTPYIGDISNNGRLRLGVFGNSISVRGDATYIGQINLDGPDGSASIGINKSAAGVLEVNKGVLVASGGSYGNVSLGNLAASGTIKPGSYTLATLPSASSSSGSLVVVSNPTASKRGDVLSDGTNWRYSDDSIAA